jgi:peptidoglycan/LPS O-acetylase OafA/YrhL
MATIIWMCFTGNGGFVNKFLSWKPFIPLSRLTYSVYLTHAWIVWIYWGSKRDLIDMRNLTILFLISGIIFMSYVLGAIFALLFESPFLKLQSHLMKNYFMNDKKAINNLDVSPLNRDNLKESNL